MKSISIHGLDDTLDIMIKEKARKQGLSINKTIKKLLEEALCIRQKDSSVKEQAFSDLFGIRNQDDLKEFQESISDLNQIDEKDWQ